ncbi:MAG: hypothetical protein WCK86_10965 [Planctomycetia bacterium]
MFSAIFRPRLMATALLGSLAIANPPHAHADHCQPVTKIVTVTEVVRQPVEVTVVRYDHCGRPGKITVTEFRTVHITVTKRLHVRN